MSESKSESIGAHLPMDIRWFKTEDHDAEAEVLALNERPREKALAVLARYAKYSRAQFRIKKTHVNHVYESKHDLPEGGLRLLFVSGKNHIRWCIGGFVKTNDSEGNRALALYASIAKLAKNS